MEKFNLQAAQQGAPLQNVMGDKVKIVDWHYRQSHKGKQLAYIATSPNGSKYFSVVNIEGIHCKNYKLNVVMRPQSKWLVTCIDKDFAKFFSTENEAQEYCNEQLAGYDYKVEEITVDKKSDNSETEQINVPVAKKSKGFNKGKPLIDKSTSMIYKSGAQAARYTGLPQSEISISARTGKVIRGHRFEFLPTPTTY